jgi:hypothetical protein
MTLLIAVYLGKRRVGQCDARCYNAQRSNCGCICGGANHGAGLEQAVKNIQEMVDRDRPDLGLGENLARYRAARGWEADVPLRVIVPAVQLDLL